MKLKLVKRCYRVAVIVGGDKAAKVHGDQTPAPEAAKERGGQTPTPEAAKERARAKKVAAKEKAQRDKLAAREKKKAAREKAQSQSRTCPRCSRRRRLGT